jgi:hypothetical protein
LLKNSYFLKDLGTALQARSALNPEGASADSLLLLAAGCCCSAGNCSPEWQSALNRSFIKNVMLFQFGEYIKISNSRRLHPFPIFITCHFLSLLVDPQTL